MSASDMKNIGGFSLASEAGQKNSALIGSIEWREVGPGDQMIYCARPIGDPCVSGWVRNNMAVHRRVDTGAHELGEPEWAVTHLPSGLNICYVQSAKNARECADALEDMADWGLPGLGTDRATTEAFIRDNPSIPLAIRAMDAMMDGANYVGDAP